MSETEPNRLRPPQPAAFRFGGQEGPADRYTGLRDLQPTLPSRAYFDPADFERDMAAVWRRNWINVCRSADLAQPLAYRTVRLGSQEILVLRGDDGVLRAFHNTCRHRGSQLCGEERGRLKSKLLVCPYHAWAYSTRGELVRVPSKTLPAGFDRADYPLYAVALAEWRGFVFVNLAEEPAGTPADALDPLGADLANWPLEELVTAHSISRVMNCNWKIFWENFNECLHCPGVHRDLSALVPIYGRGLMARHDDPDWADHADDRAPEYAGTLRAGAETWSRDGKARGAFQGLTEAEREAGQTYAVMLPSLFVVGHVDYVRSVRMRPLSAEQTELTAEWLFPADGMEPGGADFENIVGFGMQVLEEDAGICEVNQRGLRSLRHEQGVLMPEEYELKRFHDWVRAAHLRNA